MSTAPAIVVPEGFKLHQENSAYLLLPSENGAFLNTVQEFNRDLSVACIRTWSERNAREKLARLEKRNKHPARAAKRRKLNEEAKAAQAVNSVNADSEAQETPEASTKEEPSTSTSGPRPPKITILEPLSATGLRAIRYAKEIPLVRHVIANDLSSDATAIMRRNVEINNLTPQVQDKAPGVQFLDTPSVDVREGDASALMYSAKAKREHVHVVDLDPYGTAAPFIDGAVQCVSDGGLLCVTCTDLAVLAGNNYPEKCFANYGGTPMKAEYCHEGALRLVLSSIAQAAARYGRSMTPLLSLSIDFYVRVFVQIKVSPIEVKKLYTQISNYYVCMFCQTTHEQPLGKVAEKVSEASGAVNLTYKFAMGPPVGSECPECGSHMNLAGPMWSGPLHDREFTKEVLDLVTTHPESFGTHARMQGMLTVANQELDAPFYFTPSKIAGFFHSEAPSLQEIASALKHAGHEVTRSHGLAGSLKTTAPRALIFDIFRNWIKQHPVKVANIKEGSPTLKLLAKEPTIEANFEKHPDALPPSNVKLVRYQQNPPNWGPGIKAGSSKRRPPVVEDKSTMETE